MANERRSRWYRTTAMSVILTGAVVLTACSSSDGNSTTTSSAANGKLNVVASTNVWASVTSAVAGDHANVTAIISDPTADPHSFEATPADSAKISSAALIVYNGGDYDPFVDAVLKTATTPSVDAYKLLPASETDGEDPANEHVWYDRPTVAAVANAVADKLSSLDSANATEYRNNATKFEASLNEIGTITDQIAKAKPQAPVLQTEPIAHYLLRTSGLKDVTPGKFTEAIENETDPAPADLAALLDLINAKGADALVYNTQAESNVTKQVLDATNKAGIPVIDVTETLPDGLDYLTWQRNIATALRDALHVSG